MSRLITIFSLFALILLFPQHIWASETCNSIGITYSPDKFSPSSSALVIRFSVNNENTLNYIKANGGYMRLHFVTPFLGSFGDYNTQSVKVNDKTFDITLATERRFEIGQDWMQTPGTHQAVLDLGSNPEGGRSGYNELCKGIKYTVGDENVCIINPELKEVPPNVNFPVAFSGKPNTKHYLQIVGTGTRGGQQLGNYTTGTNESGQGIFANVSIAGKADQSETAILTIRQGEIGFPLCERNLTTSITASNPNPSPTAVPTAPPGTTIGSGGKPVTPEGRKICVEGDVSCTSAGGRRCGTDNDPGIATAIGCIHTNPLDFIKDLLRFLTAIGGGLAFLMMLLGAFQMITSAGNPETLQGGRDRFQSAIIGLLFVIFAVLLLQIIGFDILKIPGFGR